MGKRDRVGRVLSVAVGVTSAALVACLQPSEARGQTFTWTGAGASDDWANPDNWAGGVAPYYSPSSAVIFGGDARTTPNVANSVSVNTVTFDATAGSYTLTGGQFAASVVINDSASLQTISAPLTGQALYYNPSLSIVAHGPLLFDNSTVSAQSGVIDGNADVTFRSTVIFASGLHKSGAGTLTLTGASNHYVSSGSFHVAAGTLALALSPGGSLYCPGGIDIGNSAGTETASLRFDADDQSFPAGNWLYVHSNSALDFNSHAQSLTGLAVDGTATNAGPTPQQVSYLMLGSGGTFNNSGGAPISAGTLYAAGGTFNSSSGPLVTHQIATQNALTTTTINSNIDLAGQTLAITGSHYYALDADLDIVGTISNGTGLDLTPQSGTPAVVRLAGTSPNSYAGPTNVTGGMLVLAKPAGVAAVPGDLRLNATGYPNYAFGRVRLDAADQIPDTATVTLDSNTTFDLNGHAETIATLAGAGNVILGNGGVLTVAGPSDATFGGNVTGSGTFRKLGTGTLTLSSGTYTADTTYVAAGTVLLAGTQWGTVVTLGGTVIVGDGTHATTVRSSWSYPNGWATGGQVTGSLTINANASVDLSANFSNNGFPPSVSFPSLAGAGTLALNAAANLTITGALSSTFSGAITGGTGALVKTGTGSLTLAGPSTYSFSGIALGQGTVVLAKPDGTNGIAGAINIVNPNVAPFGPGPATLRLGANNQTGGNTIAVYSNGTFDLNNFNTACTTLTLSGGTVTTGPAGTLTATTFSESSGTFSGNLVASAATLTNGTFAGQLTADSFTYSNGTFSGHLTVNNTATFSNNFNATGGMTAYANVTVAAGRSLTFGGTGLDNQGSLTFSGGTLGGTGPIVNSNRISGFGSIGGSGGFTNNLLLSVTGGNLTLSNTGSNYSYGNIDLATAAQLICTGGPLTNQGTITLAASSITGTATLYNNSSIIGRGLISVPVVNTGTIQPQGGTVNLTQPFLNAGLIKLSTGSSLAGASVNNTGTIQGDGTVSNPITNNGTLEPAGTLQLAGAVTNPAGGLISLPGGSKLLISTGLATNAGTISLIGGTFDNNAQSLTNTGQITGYGTFRTGGTGLTNDGTVTLTGGTTTVNGPVINKPARTIEVRYNPAIFTSLVTNNGKFKITNANVTFAADSTGIPGFEAGGIAVDGILAASAAPVSSPTPGLAGNGSVVVDSSGVLTTCFIRQDSLTSSGTVKVQPAALGGGTSVLGAVSLTGAGTLDLTDNALVLDYTGPSPAEAVRQYLAAGYAGGTWAGTGITSSAAAADPRHLAAVAWAEASQLGVTSFAGVAVDGSAVLLRYASYGDANVDGRVDADDYALVDRGMAKRGTGWVNGDFNYDGAVDLADYLLLDTTFVRQAGSMSPGLLADREARFGPAYVSELVASVPEPSIVGLTGVGLTAAGGKRRRRR